MEGTIANIMELIPGFKFHPSDEELLLDHLRPKIEGTQVDHSCVIPEVEVCQYDPWHLPKIFHALSIWKSRNRTREWTFFSPRKRKYSKGQRSVRTTPSGHWKVTGVKRDAKADDGSLMGTRTTLVFHKGRIPNGKRTNWVMHEFHLNVSSLSNGSYGDQLPYVACRIRLKKDKKGMNTDDYSTEDSEDIFDSFSNQQQLDNSAPPEYNAYNGDNAFYNEQVPPSPPLLSPSSLSYCDSFINWDHVPNGDNDSN